VPSRFNDKSKRRIDCNDGGCRIKLWGHYAIFEARAAGTVPEPTEHDPFIMEFMAFFLVTIAQCPLGIILKNATMHGKLLMVKHLVEHYQVDAAFRDEDGRMAFHYASATGQFDIVRYFIEDCHVDAETKK
jgi:Ankyrin repeats (3 copies)